MNSEVSKQLSISRLNGILFPSLGVRGAISILVALAFPQLHSCSGPNYLRGAHLILARGPIIFVGPILFYKEPSLEPAYV